MDSEFETYRCNVCRAVLFEADKNTVGTIKKHCKRCGRMRTLKLPLQTASKKTNIFGAGNGVPAAA